MLTFWKWSVDWKNAIMSKTAYIFQCNLPTYIYTPNKFNEDSVYIVYVTSQKLKYWNNTQPMIASH